MSDLEPGPLTARLDHLEERVDAYRDSLEGLREAVQYLLRDIRERRGPKVIDDEGNVVPGAPLPEGFTLPPLPSTARSSSEFHTGDDPQSPETVTPPSDRAL